MVPIRSNSIPEAFTVNWSIYNEMCSVLFGEKLIEVNLFLQINEIGVIFSILKGRIKVDQIYLQQYIYALYRKDRM